MTLSDEAKAILQRVKLVVPEGTTLEVAQEKVMRAILRRLITQASDAGVILGYAEWLGLSEFERACWEQIAMEKQQRHWAMFAAACGNAGMARAALHADDPDALVEDAIEQGLKRAGLG